MAAPRVAFFVTAIALLFVNSQQDESVQFTYLGATGPDHWGILSPNFSMCNKGKLQSPINILTSQVVVNKNLKPLIRSYEITNVTLVNNKFNVGVRYPDHSGGLMVEGKMYKLIQMHWHAPSEHRINGRRFAAELHLVHVAGDGSVSVIAILFRYGHSDPLLAKIQNKLNELAYEMRIHKDSPITFGPFHPSEVRKRCHKYYRYVGSFTTPPCTQNVIWNILARVRSISRKQVEALRAPLDMRCKNNARPCQPMNGRHVEMYDEDEPIPHGH
ncbi:alpha carbonic anhydrase 1, chloroplastic isoform X2 [Andrographis paniculata]|uniref:alpha carbonic anhydrase 1, chloroplastic isoform X2 n=1 Tax=Andrographis paniculata TaxID=175694 RepID=UPI0021E7CDBB|nr:alpha carbonic anhydrase 1, chloroplastic isoform X2 [Andrographis paniculata]